MIKITARKTQLLTILVPGKDYRQINAYLIKGIPPDDEDILLKRSWATTSDDLTIFATLTSEDGMQWEIYGPGDDGELELLHFEQGPLSTTYVTDTEKIMVVIKPDPTYE